MNKTDIPVMLMEDDDASRDQLLSLLGKMGYHRVSLAKNVNEAFQVLNQNQVSLVWFQVKIN